MSRRKTTESTIEALVKKYPKLLFVDSNEKGLYYAVDPNDDRIAILCGGGVAIFTLEQLYTAFREVFEVWANVVNGYCDSDNGGHTKSDGI